MPGKVQIRVVGGTRGGQTLPQTRSSHTPCTPIAGLITDIFFYFRDFNMWDTTSAPRNVLCPFCASQFFFWCCNRMGVHSVHTCREQYMVHVFIVYSVCIWRSNMWTAYQFALKIPRQLPCLSVQAIQYQVWWAGFRPIAIVQCSTLLFCVRTIGSY